ncbi:MAG: ChbG/HpnK family deacetylase [Bryobacteraceae bacterium]
MVIAALAESNPRERVLVVNADDFGFTRDVNEGIVEAHRHGILTATTLMANGPEFHHAVLLAKDNPSLDVGVHLVLVGERALTRPGRALPRTVSGLVSALARRDLDVEKELDAQIRRVLDAGIRPTHLDTHKHTHLLPSVLDAVARLSEKYGIRWVRRPFDISMPASMTKAPLAVRFANAGLGVMRRRFARVLKAHGCRSTDWFAGFQMTGRYDGAQLAALIRRLPEGSTEFMCHPGRLGEQLREARTRLKESREAELRALTAPEVREAVELSGVRLARYRDLAV